MVTWNGCILVNTGGVVLGCMVHTQPQAGFSHARFCIAPGTDLLTTGRKRAALSVCNLLCKGFCFCFCFCFLIKPNVCSFKVKIAKPSSRSVLLGVFLKSTVLKLEALHWNFLVA